MTNELNPEERRITLRLMAYWEKKRAGRSMPTEEDMDPADIADLWEYCFMAHTQDIGRAGYDFTYLGKAIEELYRDGEDGPAVFPDMEILAKGYKEVISRIQPLVTEGEITNVHGTLYKYRQVLLPLGVGSQVKAIMGGMRFLRIVSYG